MPEGRHAGPTHLSDAPDQGPQMMIPCESESTFHLSFNRLKHELTRVFSSTSFATFSHEARGRCRRKQQGFWALEGTWKETKPSNGHRHKGVHSDSEGRNIKTVHGSYPPVISLRPELILLSGKIVERWKSRVSRTIGHHQKKGDSRESKVVNNVRYTPDIECACP